MRAGTEPAACLRPEEATRALAEARERTLALVAPLTPDELERVHSPLMSPLVWDLGHIAAYEDLWIAHRTGGRPLLRDDLADVYDAFETPRAGRGALPFLRTAAARDYLAAVRERTVAQIAAHGVGDGTVVELVLRHEQQHNETMLQALQLARLDGYAPAGLPDRPDPGTERDDEGGDGGDPGPPTGLGLITVPSAQCTIGAGAGGFAYDNERPRHDAAVPAFRIGRTPVTNASYLAFTEGGGYERREWWSDEGWSWKEQYDITRPGGWSEDLRHEWRLGSLQPLEPSRPVIHVSWFEADAFARAHGFRLPTEREWERAATWDQAAGEARTAPWGEAPTAPGVHANVDLSRHGPAACGGHPAGAAPCGAEGMIGDVWEWTATDFHGYDGFVAHPYREYSEVFFGPEYKVLRGGSWATRARVATATFRNWDLPVRRQIFSGFRVAADLP